MDEQPACNGAVEPTSRISRSPCVWCASFDADDSIEVRVEHLQQNRLAAKSRDSLHGGQRDGTELHALLGVSSHLENGETKAESLVRGILLEESVLSEYAEDSVDGALRHADRA